MTTIYPVVLCGGSGTRLWPRSRKSAPKPFLPLVDEDTLFEATLARCADPERFADPVVVTGPVTNDELALRSSIGLFLFAPQGVNERFIEQAGLRLVRQEDVTGNAARIAGRWHASREAHGEELLRIEGEPRFVGLQRFFDAVHRLTSERRLSRIVYLVEKRGD